MYFFPHYVNNTSASLVYIAYMAILWVSLHEDGHEANLTLVRTYIFSFIGFLHKYFFRTFPRFLSSLFTKSTALSHCFYINFIKHNIYWWKHSFLFLCVSTAPFKKKLLLHYWRNQWNFSSWGIIRPIFFLWCFACLQGWQRCNCVKINTGQLFQGTVPYPMSQAEVKENSLFSGKCWEISYRRAQDIHTQTYVCRRCKNYWATRLWVLWDMSPF